MAGLRPGATTSPVQSSLPHFHSCRLYSSSAPRPSEAKVEEYEEARKMVVERGSPRQWGVLGWVWTTFHVVDTKPPLHFWISRKPCVLSRTLRTGGGTHCTFLLHLDHHLISQLLSSALGGGLRLTLKERRGPYLPRPCVWQLLLVA